jgi:hypothetical protein
MGKSRLEALLIKGTFFVSVLAFMVCAAISVHSALMAKKIRKTAHTYTKMQGKTIDRCLSSDTTSCVTVQTSAHEPEYAGLSSQHYEERTERYGVAAVLFPFLILTAFFAGRWIVTGKDPWSYGSNGHS